MCADLLGLNTHSNTHTHSRSVRGKLEADTRVNYRVPANACSLFTMTSLISAHVHRSVAVIYFIFKEFQSSLLAGICAQV